MMQDMTKVFDAIRKKAEAQANPSGGGNSFFGNPNILKLKQGTSYKLRLLWINPPDGMNREYPMINQYVHHIWDNDAIGSKNVEVFCKTSQYDEGETRAGWECPICKEMSKCYKEYSTNGSESAKEIYDTFRRTFRGYVPVYVISGPEEDLHKVKILQYTKTFKDFFDLKIFGITKGQKNDDGTTSTVSIDEDDILGIQAFTYYEPKNDTVQTEAYDLIITVNTKSIPIRGKMTKVPDYKIDFSRKMSEIDFDGEPITTDRYLGLSDELRFDKDFLKISSMDELEAFMNKYIKNSSNEDDINEVQEEEIEKPAPKSEKLDKLKEISKAQKPTSSKPKKEDPIDEVDDLDDLDLNDNNSTEDEESETNNSNDVEDEDVDIDDILKDLD